MTRPLKSWLIISSILLTSFKTYILLPPKSPLSPASPTEILNPLQNGNTQESNYEIIGFLPYWNVKKLTPEAINSTTHLAYFTLHLGGDGHVVKLDRPGEEEPGYTNYKRILSNSDIRPESLILTFMPYDQDALQSLLNNSNSRRQAVRTIQTYMEESRAAGVNVDYEPLGGIPPSLKNNFTLFIQELSQELSAISHKPQAMLSISIYPSAASRPRIWDLAALAEHTDHFVVMTYDYHLPTSDISGPNSPLRGAGKLFEHDILKNLAEITKLVDSRQILLGIPFYGYEWDTDSNMKYSPSDTRAAVASLERIQELVDENTLELLWDHNSLTPYAIRRDEDNEIISQIYYESVDSIRLKLELVKSAGLGGIAIWALGYEGDNPNLWSTIRSLNTP